MPTGVQIWVKEHKPDSGLNAAELADNYFQARKGIDFEKKFQNRKHENRNNQEKTVKGTPEVDTRDHARKEKLREENELKSEKASGVISHQLDDVVNFQEEFGHLDGQLLSNNPPKEKVHKTRSEKRKVRKEFAKTKEAQSSQDSELDILDIGRDKIKDYQVKDRTLISLREQMLVQKDDDTIKIVCKDGILFRQVFTKHQTEPIEQLVVPYPCRNSVLKVSHDIPLAGHLGRKKTLDRIKQRFFWPGIRKDVTEYCNTCENCQKTSKYKTKLKAPMIPMSVIVSEPFRQIYMNIVGSLLVIINNYVVCYYGVFKFYRLGVG
ncbi:uncharacterized protein [Antedon mediterranea]|uniref:uncharacterized protein n=1 Tax=Antedon mediterranea TaxID=105859 RepID=UPI003AF7FB8A